MQLHRQNHQNSVTKLPPVLLTSLAPGPSVILALFVHIDNTSNLNTGFINLLVVVVLKSAGVHIIL